MKEKYAFIALIMLLPLGFAFDGESSMFVRMMNVAGYCLVWFLLIFMPNFWLFAAINVAAIIAEYIAHIPLFVTHFMCFVIAALAILYNGYKAKNLSRSKYVYIPNRKSFAERCNDIYVEFRAGILSLIK